MLKVEGGIITLKPVVGAAVEIPLADVNPEEFAKAAGLLKGGAEAKRRAAVYYIVRRELDAAGKVLEGISGRKASALRDDIKAFSDAIAAAAKSAPVAVTGGAKPEPGADPDVQGAGAPASAELRSKLKIAPAGNIGIANAWMYVHYAGPGWKSSVTQAGAVTPDRGFPVVADGKWSVRGKFNLPKTPATFDFEQTVEDLDANSVRYRALLTNAAGVDTESLFLTIGLPVPALAGKEVAFDDQTKVFPKEKAGSTVFNGQNISRTVIPVNGGRIVVEGKYGVYVQDSRNHNNDCFEIRLTFKTDGRVMKKGELDVTMRFEAGASDVVASKTPAGGAAKPAAPEPVAEEGPKEPLPGETGMPGQWAPGLIAEIFEGPKFKKRLGARIDRQIDYHIGGLGIDPCMGKGDRTIRWTGMLLLPSDGKYIFDLDCPDNKMEVMLDGSTLIKKGKSTTTLEEEFKGGLHELTMTYSGAPWWGAAKLRWLPPWGQKVSIPAENFFHVVPEVRKHGPHAKLVQGMWAEYFAGDNFEQKVAEAPVLSPSFDLDTIPPVPGLPKNRWSVRFSGKLFVDKDGEMGFSADAEGGVRARLDGASLVDKWNSSKWEEGKLKKNVKKGFRPIVVEYRHRGGKAKLKVRYAMPGHGNKNNPGDISTCAVFHEPRKPVLVDRKGLAPGLKGAIFAGERPGGRALLRHWSASGIFNWKDKSPDAKVPVDRFSCAWEGVLLAPRTGKYTFHVRHKGGFMLTVSRQKAGGNWRPVDEVNGETVVLKKGKNEIKMGYFNRSGDASAEVWWSGPTFGMRPLTSDVLAHSSSKLAMKLPTISSDSTAWREAFGAMPAVRFRICVVGF